MACLTMSPAISGTNITSLPSTFSTAPMTRLSDWLASRAPLGRPKWASSNTLAPLADSSRMVGTAARTRLSSVTAPSFIGKLKSTRTSATLPVTSPRSSSLRNSGMFGPSVSLRRGAWPLILAAQSHKGRMAVPLASLLR